MGDAEKIRSILRHYKHDVTLTRAWFLRSTGTAAEIQRAVDLLFTGGGTVTEGNFSVSIVAVEPRNTVWAVTLEHAAQLIPRPAGVGLTLTRAMS